MRWVWRLIGLLLILLGASVAVTSMSNYVGHSPLPTAEQFRANQQIKSQWRSGVAMPNGVKALISIPALGRSWQYPLYEGTGDAVLDKGMGHYQGTAEPGQRGNFAFAGHRSSDIGFEPLADLPDKIKTGDQVIVDTSTMEYVYRVTGTENTNPDDSSVLRSTSDATVTITTCTPRYGSSGRFIVFGKLASETPRA